MAINNLVNIKIKAVENLSEKLDGIKTSANWLNKWLNWFKQKIESMQDSFQKMATFWGVAFGALTYGVNNAITEAVDLGESINAVNVVFGKSSEKIKEFWKTASTSVWLANSEFNQLSTETGTLLKASWMNIDSVADSTIDLTKRASDLASVFNTDVQTAMSAINQALRGETEAIRKFWSDVTDASLEQFLLAQWINKSASEMTQQEKILYRMQKIMQDTNQVTWDFANTSDSLANRQRVLASQVTDLKARFWELMIPVKELIFNALTPLLEKLTVFIEKNPVLAKNIALTALWITGLITVVWTLGLLLPSIIWGFAALTTATTVLWTALLFLATNPIWMVITAIWAGIAIWVLIVKNWETIKEKSAELGNKLLELYEKYKILFAIFTPIIAIWVELYKNWDVISAKAVELGQSLQNTWNWIKETIVEIVNNIVSSVTSAFDSLTAKVTGAFNAIKGTYDKAKSLASKIGEGISNTVSNVKQAVSWAKAIGWPVMAGSTYRVNEQGQEFFTPTKSGYITPAWSTSPTINISLWNVNVYNEADENRLVDKIKQALRQETKAFNYWIA